MAGRLRANGMPAAVLLVAIGVALHVPDFYAARMNGFRMVGMGFSPLMTAGMGLIVIGLLVGFGSALAPGSSAASRLEITVTTIDDRRLRPRDLALLLVLAFGLVIDVMKPATIGFVAPGARAEYHLTLFQVALWPLIALIGTTVGSVLWGVLGDRIGRRISVLLAALLFVGTSVCGAMPAYWLNLVMCFVMGMSAGGMLPLVFALLSEVMPRTHRGWMLVSLGCVTAAGGYLAASAAAAILEPVYSWRVLWLIGLPTGALLIALSRFIPESPRYLVRHGRQQEAVRQLLRLGARVEIVERLEATPAPRRRAEDGLFSPGRRLVTSALALFGVSWGLINFGILTWLPTVLRASGGGAGGARLLASAALVSVPGSLVAPVLYGRWRTRASMVVFAFAIVAALVGIGLTAGGSMRSLLFAPMIVVLLSSLAGTNAMLQIYAAEIFPTAIRASGAGVAAAATKFGGIAGPQVVALILGLGQSIGLAALLLAVPMAVAAAAIILTGGETIRRPLDEISAVELSAVPEEVPAALP